MLDLESHFLGQRVSLSTEVSDINSKAILPSIGGYKTKACIMVCSISVSVWYSTFDKIEH